MIQVIVANLQVQIIWSDSNFAFDCSLKKDFKCLAMMHLIVFFFLLYVPSLIKVSKYFAE